MFTKKEVFIAIVLVVLGLLWLSHGYLFNNAKTQSRDIKLCQSAGADWRYSDNNQVLCIKPKKKECD